MNEVLFISLEISLDPIKIEVPKTTTVRMTTEKRTPRPPSSIYPGVGCKNDLNYIFILIDNLLWKVHFVIFLIKRYTPLKTDP